MSINNINWRISTPAGPESTLLIPTYGNYGGYDYSGGKVSGDDLTLPPKDQLDAVFQKHDIDYKNAQSPQDTINADIALIKGILNLPPSALYDPDARAYANATIIAFLGELNKKPGGEKVFSDSSETYLTIEALKDFSLAIIEGNLPITLGLFEWAAESAAQSLINLGIENLDTPYPDFIRPLLPPWLGPLLTPLFLLPGISPYRGGAMVVGNDPLVLDLNGDGKISLTNIENGVQFDYLRDGFAERNAWVKPQDGMLVLDKNKNGKIEGHSEMVASPHPLSILQEDDEKRLDTENGFAYLGRLDGNNDGVIDSKDAVFKTLQVWKDRNQDGISQKNELKTLSQLKIASINYGDAQLVNYVGILAGGFIPTEENNVVTHQSTFTLQNGDVRKVVDAWLDHDLTNSVYDGNKKIDPKVLFLPNLKGHGTLPDLHIAMSKDKALLKMVERFEAKYSVDNFATKANSARADFEKILMKWAGVTPNQSPTPSELSYTGIFEYMPEYEFLRKLTGMNNKVFGPWFDERPFLPYMQDGVPGLHQAFDDFVDGALYRVLMQVGESALFRSTPAYLPFSGEFSFEPKLTKAAVNKLQLGAKDAVNKLDYWHNVAKILDSAIGIEKLTTTEVNWLNSAVRTSSVLDWQEVKATVTQSKIPVSESTPEVFGTKYDDQILANDFYSAQPVTGITFRLHGGAGDDVLSGRYELLNNRNADAFLDGGPGNDILYAGGGNTTYYYTSGHDVIYWNVNYPVDTNTIQFAPSIKLSDIKINIVHPAVANAPMQRFIAIEGKGTISLSNNGYVQWVPFNEVIDQLKFSDGKTLALSDMVPNYIGSSKNDNLQVGLDVWNKNANVYGFGGNDQLNGAVNDASETFYGGAGNDTINGMGGNDRYVYESGNDTFYEAENSGVDAILFQKGVTTQQVSLQRITANGQITDDLRILVQGKGSILIEDAFLRLGFEKLKFAGGQTFDLTSLLADSRQDGSPDGDRLIGRDSAPIYLQDHLVGSGGNDRLDGKKGNDILEGGEGDDRYIVGDGIDTIYDHSGTDSIIFGSQYDLSKFTFKVLNSSDLEILYNGQAKVKILGQFGPAVENLTVAGKGSIDLTSQVYDQIGTEQNDSISGIYYGGSTNNRIFGKGGNDQLYGGDGNDRVNAGSGNDFLQGGTGDDTLIGGTGNDFLEGEGGSDNLYGGKGLDQFVFRSFGPTSEVDAVFDFNLLEKDKLDLIGITYGFSTSGKPVSDFANIRQSGTDSVVSVDSSGSGTDFVDVAVLKDTTGLTDVTKLYQDGTLLLW
jgi:Ca2+-binding RTX toxin-like protein